MSRSLYFSYMGGAGTIICNSCNYREEIISFTHQHGRDPLTFTGLQCQKCGNFQGIINYHKVNDKEEILCNKCGGNLSRNEPLFCPICKSKDLHYSIKFLT